MHSVTVTDDSNASSLDVKVDGVLVATYHYASWWQLLITLFLGSATSQTGAKAAAYVLSSTLTQILSAPSGVGASGPLSVQVVEDVANAVYSVEINGAVVESFPSGGGTSAASAKSAAYLLANSLSAALGAPVKTTGN